MGILPVGRLLAIRFGRIFFNVLATRIAVDILNDLSRPNKEQIKEKDIVKRNKTKKEAETKYLCNACHKVYEEYEISISQVDYCPECGCIDLVRAEIPLKLKQIFTKQTLKRTY